MNEDIPDDLSELADVYLSTLDADPGGASKELHEDLQYWEEQVEEFEEGTPMHEMAVEERDKVQKRIDEIETKGNRREELGTELLTKASKEFAPQENWLKVNVIKALTHALTGQQMDQLIVGEHTLPEANDELSKREMVEVAKTVHALARDASRSDERIAELWSKLDTDTQQSILGVLANHGEPLSANSISEKLGEDGTDSPGSNIRYLRSETEIDVYRSSESGYTLTLAGSYLWNEYGEDMPELQDDMEKQETETEDTELEKEEDEKEGSSPADEPSESSESVDLSSFEIKE